MNKIPVILIISSLITLFISSCTKISISGSAVKDDIKITTPEIRCYDSDGGDVIDVKGMVTIRVNNNDWVNYTDECANRESVLEYFCDNESYKNKSYYCDNACINGMCR